MEKILGNDNLIESLRRIAASDHVANGYIISGISGSGKRMIAEYFAGLLKCSAADTLYPEHEKPNLFSVEDVRTGINQTVFIKPYDSPRKVYIVEDADKMNVQAQNALLKTLEEPPEYVVIILLSDNPDVFLQTIRSRCVLFTVNPLPEDVIRDYLLSENYEEEQADSAARLSMGSLGKALLMVESEEFSEMLSKVTEILRNMHRTDTRTMLGSCATISAYKNEAAEILELTRLWFLDVLYYKTTSDQSRITFRKEGSVIRTQAKIISFEGINRIMEIISESGLRVKANVNFELTTELLLLKIKEELQERN